MFASLTTIDIVVENEGKQIAIQTDHRTPEEIQRNLPISLVFGASRVLNPLRQEGIDEVVLSFAHAPPEEYASVMRAFGAEVLVSQEPVVGGAHLNPDARLAAALTEVGLGVLEAYRATATERGLSKVQALYLHEFTLLERDADSDPESYWQAVVELGAVIYVVLAAEGRALWTRDPEHFSVIPFMVQLGPGLANVFSKVERFFRYGASHPPVELLQMQRDMLIEEGPLTLNLRPSTWGAAEFSLCRPLLTHTEALKEVDIPLVAVVRDLPNTVRTLSIAEDSPEIWIEAGKSIPAVEVMVEKFEAGEGDIWVVHNSFYAAEKIFDEVFLIEASVELGAVMLAAMPSKGHLLLASAANSPGWSAAFGQLVKDKFEESAERERLSPTVFLVRDAVVIGVSDPEPEPVEPFAVIDESDPNPPVGSFFSRLFREDLD